jgi:Ca2+-binding EF-hand superfamily protein
MAISCGTVANAIFSFAHAQQKEKKLNANMTEDELVMLKHLGVEDNDGFIHNAEFTILLLVRIGALKANLIEVLLDRFQEIDRVGNGNVSYTALKSMKSFMGHSALPLLKSFKSSLKGSFKKSLKKSFSGGND